MDKNELFFWLKRCADYAEGIDSLLEHDNYVAIRPILDELRTNLSHVMGALNSSMECCKQHWLHGGECE